jgi:tripartite-type tricarboxylate transporter receptor subunit TctC
MVLALTASGYGQEQFYRGKTIRIVVGFSAGGGFDTYARALARYMGKHIAGNPAVIVDNMAGAGSLKLSPANSSSIRAWSPHSKTSSTIESYARHG